MEGWAAARSAYFPGKKKGGEEGKRERDEIKGKRANKNRREVFVNKIIF